MKSFISKIWEGSKNDILMGMFQTLGADPISASARRGGDMTASFFGRELVFNKGTGMPKFGGHIPLSYMSMGLNAFTAGSAAYDVYKGYQEKGITGAGRALVMNAALNASLVKHAYRITENAGVLEYQVGKFAMGRSLSKLATLGNIADFGMRAAWGSMLGEAAAKAAGGGMLSTPFAMAGASVGARFGPMLTVGALGGGAVVGSAYLAAKGTGAILKAGYQHTQMKKLINTDGDMSAFMTQNAFTMRSRAVQAMSKSHMNAREALGQEANLMMFPSRNYHSMYSR
jgi:hypothetical protein